MAKLKSIAFTVGVMLLIGAALCLYFRTAEAQPLCYDRLYRALSGGGRERLSV